MKVKVTSRFQDEETGKYRDPGETMDVPEKRAKRIVSVGCGEIVPEPEPTSKDKPKRKRGRPRKKRAASEDKALKPTEDK